MKFTTFLHKKISICSTAKTAGKREFLIQEEHNE